MKDQKFEQVFNATLEICSTAGLKAVTLSRVSQKSGVSRSWIYKYVGKNTQTLLESAALALGKKFAELEDTAIPETTKETKEYWINGARRTLDDVEKHPWITALYFEYLGVPHPIGKAIEEVLNHYHKKNCKILKQVFKLESNHALSISIHLVHTRMSLAHAWLREKESKTLGRDFFIDLMMAPIKNL